MSPLDVIASEDAAKAGRGDRIARWLLLPLVVVLVTTIFVFFVYFESVRVVGPSMLPGLRNGDYLLMTKGYADPVRGDIVVFTETDRSGTIDVVKRVIGVPGDTVAVSADGATVDGAPEPARDLIKADGGSYPPVTVPAGAVYVMGDNRPVSLDSRFRGPIPMAQVRGRAVFRFAPITRLGWVR